MPKHTKSEQAKNRRSAMRQPLFPGAKRAGAALGASLAVSTGAKKISKAISGEFPRKQSHKNF